MRQKINRKVDEIGNKVSDLGNIVEGKFSEGKEKMKKPITRLLFSRIMFIALMTFLQFGLSLLFLNYLGEKYSYFIEICALLSVIVIIWIINSKTDPAYKITWTLVVETLPVMGIFLYLYAHLNIDGKLPFKKLNKIIDETEVFAKTSDPVKDRRLKTDTYFNKMGRYLENIGKAPTYDNTEAKHYPSGEACFYDLCTELEKAEEFIFMEFFIIEEGLFLNTLLDILLRKIEQGVEVRFMYDDLGSANLVPKNYSEKLCAMGINAKAFSKLKVFFSTRYNNRDHRKMIIIDGKVAFSGGINVADEYINEVQRFGYWKDNVFCLKGDAVNSYTLMFLQMWNVNVKSDHVERFSRYLNIDSGRVPDLENDGFVIPYGDGPHKQDNVAENVYLDVINNATHFVSVMTPYLIPDNEVLHALKHAAKSGVVVNIIVPGIPDKKAVNILTKSYYPELIRSGVHIFEYDPGFVHAKMMVADGIIAVEGTVNLDYRSLYLHYECGCVIYKNKAIADIVDDFKDTLDQCHEVNMEEYRNYGIIYRWTASVLRMLAPLM